jgi:hypothetical protein
MNALSGRHLAAAFLCMVAVVVAAGPGSVAVPAATTIPHPEPTTAGDAALRVVSSSSQQVELVFKPGELRVDRNARGVALRAYGADPLAQPGEPDLPGRVVLVGVPQTGAVRLEAYPGPTEVRHDLAVRPAVDFSPSVPQARAMYDQDRFWPAAPAEIVGIFTLRGVRVARVRLNPVQYNPKTGETRFCRELRVVVRFADEPRKRVGFGKPNRMLERVLVNGSEARYWLAGEPGLDTDSVNFFDRYTDWCKVKTETTGVYRVTGAELAEAGFITTGIDPAALRLFTIGEYTVNEYYPDTMVEVLITVHDGGDGSFDADDYVAFYAESPSTWKTDTAGNAHWYTNYFTYLGRRVRAPDGNPVRRGRDRPAFRRVEPHPARGRPVVPGPVRPALALGAVHQGGEQGHRPVPARAGHPEPRYHLRDFGPGLRGQAPQQLDTLVLRAAVSQ